MARKLIGVKNISCPDPNKSKSLIGVINAAYKELQLQTPQDIEISIDGYAGTAVENTSELLNYVNKMNSTWKNDIGEQLVLGPNGYYWV